MSHAVDRTASLSADEKRALLARLLRERSANSPAAQLSVPRMVEAQAKRSPDAIAVTFGGKSLTYGELNARANALARHLRSLGVGPEVRVGLCVERSLELMVGLLGILRAGGAYVPLDPAFPQARLALMLDDAQAAVLVTTETLASSLPAHGAQVVCLGQGSEAPLAGIDDPAEPPAPESLAYVIYTSGSTGRPKGVQIAHGALTNFLLAMRSLLGVGAQDVLLSVTTLSFDIAGLELFLPLVVGGRVELVAREEAADGARLAARLQDPAITCMQATPATWRLLLEAGWSGSPGLAMLCGGEALPRDLADRLIGKGKVLWNLYGPTETTIWSSAAQVEPGSGLVPIGRPIANTQMYVLDARLRPVPIGVTGELYIGGHGVARGYLHNPALTAERFLPDPHGPVPGARIYRTGDLARWRADGSLECLGRVDHQVKIRGFRVELGEVESALGRHPGVREAVAVVREDASGEQGLVAYVVGRPGGDRSPAELRRWLQDVLPEYMVPATFVELDAVPRLPNGKVDRSALPDPDQKRQVSEAYVPARGPVEEALVGVWCELLGRDRVGIRDNFFDLGGHSLIAVQLLAWLRDTFGIEPSLRAFLEEPTIAHLARIVERELAEGAGVRAPAIQRVGRDGPLPASFAQQRLWFLDQLEPDQATYNIPMAVRLRGPLDVSALHRALNETVRRHEVLRTTFSAEGGVPRQVIAAQLDLPLPVVDLGALTESEREAEALRLVHADAARPFDLARGPLVRAGLIRLSTDDNIAHVTMHHIVSDGWSVGVLIHEVAALYEAFHESQPSPLPEPAIQYADYSAWQREWLQGQVLDDLLAYWTSTLAGVPQLALPTDRPWRPGISQKGAQRTLLVPQGLASHLRTLSRKERATLFMTLLAAFKVLLHRYSGQTDIAVGTPIAGRSRTEIEDLIGLFVNTLVLRTELAGDPSFRELLGRVREVALGGYAHQDLPFDQVVNALHPDRGAGRSPLFQVMFVLQNAPLPSLESPELALTPLTVDSGVAKFDLTFSVTEAPEGLLVAAEYSRDLFEPATVDRMLRHYQTLLEGIVVNPEMPISQLPMMTEAELRMVLGQGTPAGLDELAAELAELTDEDLDPLLLSALEEKDATDE